MKCLSQREHSKMLAIFNYLSILQITKDLHFCSVRYHLEDKFINLLVSGTLPRLFETKSLLSYLSDFAFPFQFHALEKEMATCSSVLAWRIPGTREPGGLPSMGLQRVGHD